MDFPPPPPSAFNYYRYAYPPPDDHHLRPPSPSPLHLILPPLPSTRLSGPPLSQFSNFIPLNCHRSERRLPSLLHQHGGNPRFPGEGHRFPDSRTDSWMHHQNRIQDPLGNRISYNDRDNRSMQNRQLTMLDLSERSIYESNGAISDRNMIGKGAKKYFNMSAKKRKAPRKSVLLRIHLGKVESNNYNRSHEEDTFPRAQVDHMVSIGADSHEGKRRKGFGRSERKMEEEREKSPMELDVSFKSNALVAKPIMSTPSPVSSPIKRSMRLCSKVEKVDMTDDLAVNLSQEMVKTGSFRELPSHLHDGIRNLNEKVILYETDSTTGCVKSLPGCDAVREDPAEKALATEVGEFDGQAPPWSGTLGNSSEINVLSRNNNIEQSPKLLFSDTQSGNCVAPNECTVQSGKKKKKKKKKKAKRKNVIPQMDEQHSKLANVLSGGVSDLQEVGAEVGPTLASSFQSLPSTSIISVSEDIHACESSENVDRSIADGCSVSNLDNGLVESQIQSVICEVGSLNDMHVHSFDNFPSLRDDPGEKVTDSVTGISVQQDNKVFNGLGGAYSPKDKECGATYPKECNAVCSDGRYSKKSRKTVAADVSSHNAENMVEKDFSKERPLGVNFTDLGGEKRKVFPSRPHVLSGKCDRHPGELTSKLPTALPFNSEEADTSLRFRVTPTGLNNPSSLVLTTCSKSPGVLLHVSSTDGEPCKAASCGDDDMGDVSADGATCCADVSSVVCKSALKHLDTSEDVPLCLDTGVLKNDDMSSKDSTITKATVSGSQMMYACGKPSSVPRSRTTKLKDKMANDHPNNTRIFPSLSENVTKATRKSVPLPNNYVNNNRPETAHSRSYRISESVGLPSLRKRAITRHVAKPRTWHRNANASQVVAAPKNLRKNVFSLCNLPKDSGLEKDVASVVQSSYIRKGYSLVRKPSPKRSDNLKETGSQKPNVVGLATSEIPRGTNAAPERPETPSLSTCVNQFDVTCPNSDVPKGELVSELPRNVSAVSTSDPPTDGLKQSILHVDHTNSSSNSDCQNRLNEGNYGKKMTYVKRKSNHLVVASRTGASTFQGEEYVHLSSSDGYYKNRKNQLVRTASEDDVRQRLVHPNESSKRLVAPKIVQDISCTKRQSGFLLRKRPLVWTLHGSFPRKQRNLGFLYKVWPYFVPWKKSTYWPNLKSSSDSVANEIPLSSISRKLLPSTKRDTIYKRSVSGFSLYRSKVRSAGARSLKWSKSMERVSKRANEDAKAAVVTPKKRRREESGPASSLSLGKGYASRERIFRIGSDRYKMDPSGRILQKISDEKALPSEGDAGNDTKKFYMPRRLLIGNDEYVCIGNGNQLIRNPKKRIRVLAAEKVRWSLHTARLRLAMKRKYCQFFTRFGKCDKDDKKCPYIHDPSKIAVCTKFLRAACSDPDCKLTHEVIPERMQDCSYFLQGLCSNESCPYRHVNVNPKSSVCEGFLRGYCADGNECRKKHTYVCPVFEATGSCEQGPNCKLHHPKNKKKAPERKALNMSKNSQGRYFGAEPAYKTETIVPNIVFRTGEDDIFLENGKFTDYVSLDVGSEGMYQGTECAVDPMCDTAIQVSSDIALDDRDELIKPIRILNRRQTLL